MPLAALAYLCDGLKCLFERLSDGLFDMARATRQITQAPYVKDIQRQIDEATEERKLKTLKAMRSHLE